MSVSETFTEAKRTRVEQNRHEQDHKPSQRDVVELLVGKDSIKIPKLTITMMLYGLVSLVLPRVIPAKGTASDRRKVLVSAMPVES